MISSLEVTVPLQTLMMYTCSMLYHPYKGVSGKHAMLEHPECPKQAEIENE